MMAARTSRAPRAMSRAIPGLHHVTAIAGAPQENVDFYTALLGQRLIKRTVNFDDPGTYHLYYGSHDGAPGTILTFFPSADAAPGRAGAGMASAVAYGVKPGGLDAWTGRLAEEAIDVDGPLERFGAPVIALADPHGLRVELIEEAGASDPVHAFHSVTLRVERPDPSARLLVELFGYEEAGSESVDGVERLRFRSPAGGSGSVVDIERAPDASIARPGAGTIHHVAFRAESDEVQLEWRERAASAGLRPTSVIDRQYFNAIYFREPGGILFEIATDPPGFAVDEPARGARRPPDAAAAARTPARAARADPAADPRAGRRGAPVSARGAGAARVVRAGPAPSAASHAVLLVHGRGGTPDDMLRLAAQLALPEVAWLALEAPGRTWWPESFLAPLERNGPGLAAGLDALALLNAEVREAGVAPGRTLVLGFSQGACLALEYGARSGAARGGIVALSGALIGTADLAEAPREAL